MEFDTWLPLEPAMKVVREEITVLSVSETCDVFVILGGLKIAFSEGEAINLARAIEGALFALSAVPSFVAEPDTAATQTASLRCFDDSAAVTRDGAVASRPEHMLPSFDAAPPREQADRRALIEENMKRTGLRPLTIMH